MVIATNGMHNEKTNILHLEVLLSTERVKQFRIEIVHFFFFFFFFFNNLIRWIHHVHVSVVILRCKFSIFTCSSGYTLILTLL